jgi:hypothetical protein
MNGDYLRVDLRMTPLARSPLRRPPPPSPSPSLSLIGMEKVIPLGTTPPKRSPLSPAADTDKPLPQRPQRSRRSSSLYSADSGYTKIIDLYTEWKVDDEADAPIALQPITYQETLTDQLVRRFTESSSPSSPLTIPHFPKHAVSIPSLRFTSEDSQATSIVDVKAAPSFVEFSRSLQAKRSEMVSSLSSLASPHYGAISQDTFWQPSIRSSPELRAVAFEYEQEHPLDEVSPRITDIVNLELVPPPLDLGRSSGSFQYESGGMLTAERGSKMVLCTLEFASLSVPLSKVRWAGRRNQSKREKKELNPLLRLMVKCQVRIRPSNHSGNSLGSVAESQVFRKESLAFSGAYRSPNLLVRVDRRHHLTEWGKSNWQSL